MKKKLCSVFTLLLCLTQSICSHLSICVLPFQYIDNAFMLRRINLLYTASRAFSVLIFVLDVKIAQTDFFFVSTPNNSHNSQFFTSIFVEIIFAQYKIVLFWNVFLWKIFLFELFLLLFSRLHLLSPDLSTSTHIFNEYFLFRIQLSWTRRQTVKWCLFHLKR